MRLTTTRVRRALDLPPRVLARQVATRAQDVGIAAWQRCRDQRLASYSRAPTGRLAFRLPPGTGRTAPGDALLDTSERYLAHRFDLLGSGWVRVAHGITCRGRAGARFPPGEPVTADVSGRWLEGRLPHACLPRAKATWKLVSDGYTPIDWQLDFISGFRWSERAWFRDVRYGDIHGADVKVPWELARMQHLPQLALAASPVGGDARLATEIQDQILDFVAGNPPRWGVNWTCSMDVGIRAVNWLVALDVLVANGGSLRADFLAVLAGSLVDHGSHIASNLEWSPVVRSNHYLADIVGLLFVAAYLPSTRTTDRWLGLALEQLLVCSVEQFLPDGGNLEGSTSYHRLSTELLLFATALAAGIDGERMARVAAADWAWSPHIPGVGPLPRPGRAPDWLAAGILGHGDHVERLHRAVAFVAGIQRPDGHVPQVGDNDSGRLLKLSPVWCRMAADEAAAIFGAATSDDDGALLLEDVLDHTHLFAAMSGLWARPTLPEAKRHSVDRAIIAGLAGCSPLTAGDPKPPRVRIAAESSPDTRTSTQVEVTITSPGVAIGEAREVHAFPDFGLYVFRGERWYLAVRCGPVGQGGRGGHDHNDQLSFELTVAGQDCVLDPGTYLYTPDPAARDRYRSAVAHSGPFLDDVEVGGLSAGPFELEDPRPGECLELGPSGFIGRVRGRSSEYRRSILFSEDSIRVVDHVPPDVAARREPVRVVSVDELSEGAHPWGDPQPYSPAYGRILAPSAPSNWRALMRRSVVGHR